MASDLDDFEVVGHLNGLAHVMLSEQYFSVDSLMACYTTSGLRPLSRKLTCM